MAITAAAGGGNWTTGATWVGGVAPTAADDALLTSASGNVTVDSGAVCRSLDCNTYTGTLTHNVSVTLTIGDGTAGAGSRALRLVAGMTYTRGGTSSAISFISTSTTQQTVATASKSMGNITFDGVAGSWILSDGLSMINGTTTLTNGSLDVNGKTLDINAFNSNNSNTRSLTLGAATINASNAGTGWNFTSVTGLTFAANTSTINLTGAAATFAGGGLTYSTVNLTGSGVYTLSGANTFTNLNRTGTAVATDRLTLNANQIISTTLTLAGNSITNRLWVTSNGSGTSRTITCNTTVTASNVDFMDITGAGTASWNLSAISGGSGDCLGNSGITFTTAAAQTWNGILGGNWSANAWTTRVPLPQDDVTVSSAFVAQTVTMDMPRAGKSLDFSGSTGLTLSAPSVTTYFFGNFTLGSGVTPSGTATLVPSGRSSNHTWTSAGKTLTWGFSFQGGSGCVYTLQDDFTCNRSAAAALIITTSSTFNANGFNVTMTGASAGMVHGGSATLNMGAGTWSFSTTAAITFWTVGTGTLNASTSTIVLTAASANTRQFDGGGKTYNTLTYTVAGSTGQLTMTGSNAFTGDFNFSDVTNARTVTFAAGTTTKFFDNFNVNGTSGKLMTFKSATGGSAANFIKYGKRVSVDYVAVQDIAAFGGGGSGLSIRGVGYTPRWYMGANSTNTSGNTGLIFTAP